VPDSPASDANRALGRHHTTPRAVVQIAPLTGLEVVVERENDRPSGRVVRLDGQTLRVGGHASNEVVLDDPAVSRFHCRLIGENGCRVEDVGSLNGTWLVSGGDPVRVRDADLPAGASIKIGGSLLRVRAITTATETAPGSTSFGAFIGKSAAGQRLIAAMEKTARTDATVLIFGPGGAGKELVASELVAHGPRKDAPFVIVDCAAITPSLLASQLFGHAKGAIAGADRERAGAFEAAHEGTIFLDEIGELPLELQPMVLRAIERQEIIRLGESTPRPIDVRIIASSNRDLEREVNRGRFREDLYFRLAVVTLNVPSLRERREDVEGLIEAFLAELTKDEGKGGIEPAAARALFSPELLADLATHEWPGNVRELRNYVERTVVLQSAARVGEAESGEPPVSRRAAIDVDVPFKLAKAALIDDFERAYITQLLAWANGNLSKAARHAGIDRMYLHRLVQHHGLRAR
jgi:DNA-binding NtrC family response regulator